MKFSIFALVISLLTAPLSGCLGLVGDDTGGPEEDILTPLRINHLQMKGTHNSYHLAPNGPTIRQYDYSHEPLEVQAEDFSVRQFELDIWWSPGQNLQVYHNQYDRGTTCQTLDQCLADLLTWSQANPSHVPLMIWIEPKEWTWTTTDTTTIIGVQNMLEDIEQDLAAAWPRQAVITPDDVRGSHANVSTAVTTDGWPLLEESRGKVMFILLAGGDLRADYHSQHPNLEGALMFTMSAEDTPEAAIFSNTNPEGDGERIQRLVEEGYIVRSRADNAEDGEADNNETARLEEAIAVGAHTISTDYPAKVDDIDYWVNLSIGCNPISAPPDCTPERITPPT
jgi:hypothetical protein